MSLLALFDNEAIIASSLKRKAVEDIVESESAADVIAPASVSDKDGYASDDYGSHSISHDDDDFSPYVCQFYFLHFWSGHSIFHTQQATASRKSVSTVSRKRPAKEAEKSAMRFVCDQCGYATNHNWLLKRHHLTHSGEKPYVCNVCTKAFRQSAHLSGHMKIHTGEKSWLCHTCGESFKRSDTLTKHRLTHVKKSSAGSCITPTSNTTAADSDSSSALRSSSPVSSPAGSPAPSSPVPSSPPQMTLSH